MHFQTSSENLSICSSFLKEIDNHPFYTRVFFFLVHQYGIRVQIFLPVGSKL